MNLCSTAEPKILLKNIRNSELTIVTYNDVFVIANGTMMMPATTANLRVGENVFANSQNQTVITFGSHDHCERARRITLGQPVKATATEDRPQSEDNASLKREIVKLKNKLEAAQSEIRQLKEKQKLLLGLESRNETLSGLWAQISNFVTAGNEALDKDFVNIIFYSYLII